MVLQLAVVADHDPGADVGTAPDDAALAQGGTFTDLGELPDGGRLPNLRGVSDLRRVDDPSRHSHASYFAEYRAVPSIDGNLARDVLDNGRNAVRLVRLVTSDFAVHREADARLRLPPR
jgi:hypothetical protein